MRKLQKQINISDEIIIADKVIKAVIKKLPENILPYIKIEFASGYDNHTGYKIIFEYFRDEYITKEVEIHFKVGNYKGWVWVKETTWLKKEDYKREYNCYQQQFTDIIGTWENTRKMIFKQSVTYICDNIQKYFSSNAERFILNIESST